MTRKCETDLMRRSLLTAVGGTLLMPAWSWADPIETPLLEWQLSQSGDLALESISRTRDAIASRTGHAIWVGEGQNRALRLDGYSVWFRHKPPAGTLRGGAMSVMVWVALEAYPVHEAALVQMDAKGGMVFRFSIDRLGFLQCSDHPGDGKKVCRSSEAMPKGRWVHLAATMGASGVVLYCDGVVCGSLPGSFTGFRSGSKVLEEVTLVLGGSPDCPMAANIFPTGVINGLLRDVRLYDHELAPGAIADVMAASRPVGAADLQLNRAWCASDPHRPLCHAQPPRAWTNEPHGLIHWQGQYHLFYQKNPNGPYWGHLNWGHMTSPDLLCWTEMPVAISPGPGFDSEGCWSGSVIEHDGRLTLVYTGVDGVKAGIALASSEDGVRFTKYAANPVIPRPPHTDDFLDFRDPYVWREGDRYYLVVGAGVREVGGTALLYRSQDLVHWDYRGQLYGGTTKSSGFFWEMPIFVQDGDRHALVVSELPGRASYWVGSWKDERFTPLSSTPQRLELFNHLLSPTPLIDSDGQIVVMGIVPDERPPKELWAAGWAHLYSLPRSWSIRADGTIAQRPHASVEALCHPLLSIASVELDNGSVHAIPDLRETSLRLKATVKRGESRSVSVLLRRSPKGEEQTVILYEWDKELLTLDRSLSSLDPTMKHDRQTTTYRTEEKDSLHLDLFVDRSVLEVFVDDHAAFAVRIYPTLSASDGVAFQAYGATASVEGIQVARLERPV